MTVQYLHQLPHIREGLDAILKNDKVFRRHPVNLDDFNWAYIGPGFSGLVRIVVGQQVSTAAAQSIWLRVQDGVSITPRSIAKTPEDDLRALGLSRAKVTTIKGLAEAVSKKHFDPESMEKLDDDAVFQAITAMKGFGPWSAQMFLMFGLARPDIWSPGDLGIQYGLQYYMKAKERPDAEQTKKAGQKFAPHRTAASLLLWHLKSTTEKALKENAPPRMAR